MSLSGKRKCSTYLIKTSHKVQKWNCENTRNWNCHESHLDCLWMISPKKANSVYLKINNKLWIGLCTLSCCLGRRIVMIVAYGKKWFMVLVKMAIFLLHKKIYGQLNQWNSLLNHNRPAMRAYKHNLSLVSLMQWFGGWSWNNTTMSLPQKKEMTEQVKKPKRN